MVISTFRFNLPSVSKNNPRSAPTGTASLPRSTKRRFSPKRPQQRSASRGSTHFGYGKNSGGCPPIRRNLRFRFTPVSFQWEFEPICAPASRAQTPIQRSNASNVLAMLYGRCVAQADFCALSSAHLPLPGHNRIDCRLIRRKIMKYRQITKATRPTKEKVVGRAEPERLGECQKNLPDPPPLDLHIAACR